MRTPRIDIIGLAACVAAFAAACSSSGAGGADAVAGGGGAAGVGGGGCHATGPGSTPGSMMEWLVDGVDQCADFVSASRSTKNGFDSLAVTGSNTQNNAVNFKVTVANGMVEAKAYPCDGVYDLLVYYAGPMTGVGVTYPSDSCTLTLTSLGSATAPATGTFSAVLKGDAGAHMIPEGTFSAVPRVMN